MLGRSARDRTSVSGSLSCHVIFSNFFKLFMWKRSSFLAWRSYTVHVSQAYSRVGKTTARYTFSFMASLMPLLSHTDFRRRPNTELALAMRVSTSSSMFTNRERVLPRYVNLSTAFSVSPPVVIAGSTYVLWGAGWCRWLGCQGCQGWVVPLTGEHVVLLGVVRPLWSPPDTQLSPVAPRSCLHATAATPRATASTGRQNLVRVADAFITIGDLGLVYLCM